MPVRNRRPDLNGLILIDKPLGWTSADVCRRLRARTGGAKVGHAGTLDPLATGLLVCCLGRATKLISHFMDHTKAYRTTIDLSAFTSTDDAEGERTAVDVAEPPSRELIRSTLDGRFTGVIEQTPPAFSAVKVQGRRAYALARAGEWPEIRSKAVRILRIDILDYRWPELELVIACGKGTYIRSIARDLGRQLDTGGSLLSLVRTRIGPFAVEEAQPADQLPDRVEADLLIPLERARERAGVDASVPDSPAES